MDMDAAMESEKLAASANERHPGSEQTGQTQSGFIQHHHCLSVPESIVAV